VKSRAFTITTTASKVIDSEPLTRLVYLHVLGNGVVYLGGSDVTSTNGLLTEKAAAPQPLTIPTNEELWAVVAPATGNEELRVLVQGD
jgi:hypothetical protein